jgi:two-component system, NarL family, sensor histidine kinase UhpB
MPEDLYAATVEELVALRSEKSTRDGIANAIPAMIGYWNRELRCVFANNAYLEWFGLTPDEAIGMRMCDLLGEELFRRNEPYVRAALAGSAQRFEREIRKPDGTMGYTDARYIPDVDPSGNVRGFSVLVSDITELHRAYAKILELAQRLETAREDERHALGRVLHEGIAQDLFAMKLELEILRTEGEGRAGVMRIYESLSGGMTRCMTDIRQIADDLRPSELGNLRIAVAIERHARLVAEQGGIEIEVEEIAPLPELEEKLQLVLFRAAQEALSNVLRHAQASQVGVTLSADEGRVTLTVVDDGVGISAGAWKEPGALGILGLRERARALGGFLAVTGSQGRGTTFAFTVPMVARVGSPSS